MRALHLFISGRVQGVGYRVSLQRKAVGHGVDGFTRNLRDGRVEAWLQGEPEAVDAVLAWCRTGPPLSRVQDVQAEDVEPFDLEGFAIAPTH